MNTKRVDVWHLKIPERKLSLSPNFRKYYNYCRFSDLEAELGTFTHSDSHFEADFSICMQTIALLDMSVLHLWLTCYGVLRSDIWGLLLWALVCSRSVFTKRVLRAVEIEQTKFINKAAIAKIVIIILVAKLKLNRKEDRMLWCTWAEMETESSLTLTLIRQENSIRWTHQVLFTWFHFSISGEVTIFYKAKTEDPLPGERSS